MRMALALVLVAGCGSAGGDRASEPNDPAAAPTTRADPPIDDAPIDDAPIDDRTADDRTADDDVADDAPDHDAVPANAAREAARETARTAGAVGMLGPSDPRAAPELEPGSFALDTETARIEIVIRAHEAPTRDAVLAALGAGRAALERCGAQGPGAGVVTLTLRDGHVVAWDDTRADGLPSQGACVREVIRHARFAPDALDDIEAVITVAAETRARTR